MCRGFGPKSPIRKRKSECLGYQYPFRTHFAQKTINVQDLYGHHLYVCHIESDIWEDKQQKNMSH